MRAIAQNLLQSILSAASIALLSGCSPAHEAVAPRQQEEAKAGPTWELAVGPKTVRVELAVTDSERARGLMNRRELAPGTGMLFIEESTGFANYWMKDTRIPLDIGFFDASGVLLEVRQMAPRNTTTVTSRSDSVRFSLEMNLGWFAANNVNPGERLDLNALRAALAARGQESALARP